MSTKQHYQNFEELLSSSALPLLVVFYSPLCGPSLLMDSTLDQVNTQMKQQLQIVEIDSENYPELASQYQVHALPTLLLFNKGQLVGRIEDEQTEDLISAECLIQRLQSLISQINSPE